MLCEISQINWRKLCIFSFELFSSIIRKIKIRYYKLRKIQNIKLSNSVFKTFLKLVD